MRRFDTIAMLDWSGVPDRGPRPAPDAIWAGLQRGGRTEAPVYLRSIAAAEAWLGALIAQERAAGRSLLLGFDFPFGYPDGAGRRIAGTEDPRALWSALAAAFDALPPGEGRFHVAARLNALFEGKGPFWFNGLKEDIAGLPRTKPALSPGVVDRRAAERIARGAFACWQMGGAGAVGSQAMTGMAMLARLSRVCPELSVWPFDPPGPVHAVEIWPSLFAEEVAQRLGDPDLPRDGKGAPIRDAAQVLAMADLVAAAQEDGRLAHWLEAVPPEACAAEGWILGVVPEEGARPRLAPPPLSDDCFALPPGVEWTPVETALALLRERLRPVTGTETLATAGADGRVLADAVQARRANPPGANAAVDGYGFAHGSTGEGPQHLPLVAGRAAAGAPLEGAVPAGRAVRILTGALLPAGVDTVVLEEDTTTDGSAIAFHGPVKRGANTRRAGEDVEAGARLLPAGHVLRPTDLALLSATGVAEVAVRRRLRVGVLSTGDEIAEPGGDDDAGARGAMGARDARDAVGARDAHESGGSRGADPAAGARRPQDDPARTFDANRPMLLSMVRRWGHEAVDLGRAPDDREELRRALDAAGVDAILTSGGASAGDEDHVSALLQSEGALAAWRIALKPGRPLALGVRAGVPVFGLPGNPVASFVCAVIFARPALAVLAGAPWPEPVALTLPAAFEKRKKPGRREYLRARIGPEGVEVFASEGSGRISGLSWAGGLVELPDGPETVGKGDPVRFLPYWAMGLG